MKNWIEIVRDVDYFNLLIPNTERKLVGSDVPDSIEVRMPCRKDAITASYDTIYHVNTVPDGIDGVAPILISGYHPHIYADDTSTAENIVPHAEDPAAAQRAGNIGMFWGKVGASGLSSQFQAYRNDDFPAIIVMINISKHYHHGVLHRKRKQPAISADYIGALWYQEPGEHVRRNGPACVLLENYKEYWEDGDFKGHRWSNYNLSWGWRTKSQNDLVLENFLGNLQGSTDMFSNSFFTDIQDEVCFITDFA
jgi:hypothetical protein